MTSYLKSDVPRKFQKLRDAANGESCINCGTGDGTVVLAHRNQDKGMGLKNPDYFALDLCVRCHQEYDSGAMSRVDKRDFFNELYPRQVQRWIEKRLMVIK